MEALSWKRNSLVGRIFFGHFSRIRRYAPEETDTCEIRKILLYAIFSWLFLGKIGKLQLIRPYYFATAILTIWLTVTFPEPIITLFLWVIACVLLVSGVMLILLAIHLAYRGITYFRTGEVVCDFLGSVILDTLDLLGRVLTNVILFLVDGRFVRIPIWIWAAAILQVNLYFFKPKWFWIAAYFYGFAVICLFLGFLVTPRRRIERSDLPPLIKKAKAKISKEPEVYKEPVFDRFMYKLFEFVDMISVLLDSVKERVCKKVVWVNGN
jgi:hypothetical protein